MRHEVIVCLAQGEEVAMHPAVPLPLDDARRWLDQEFIRLGCEPLRASGKVLFADKLLAVADAAGSSSFSDAVWADHYARAALGALGRTSVRISLVDNSVGR